MAQVTTLSGRSFTALDGETVLDAALRSGVGLSYSCRTGRCSTCKGRIVGGRSDALHDETGLTAREREAGWVLTCVRQPVSDLTLDIEELDSSLLPAPRTLPCKVHAIEPLASDVVRVLLRFPPASPLPFVAGQYVDVIGAGGIRRSYSIANAERPDKLVELHIRQVPDGMMSRYWFDAAKPADLLRVHGPLGTFFLRELDGRDLVFLATGTGIAPVKAMLEAMATDLRGGTPRSISVYWGGRTPRDLYWQPEASAVAHRFTPVLSRAPVDWDGARGHVQQALLASAPELARTVVYACGSDVMIRSAKEALVAAGLDPHRFHSDAFVCSSEVHEGATPT